MWASCKATSQNSKGDLVKKLLLSLAVVVLVQGCAVVSKVEPGTATVGERMTVPADTAWNQLGAQHSGSAASAAVWTQEGLPIDQVVYFVGVKDGATLGQAQTSKEQRPIVFKSSMQAHEAVALFEALYTRDGSLFALDKLQPVDFLGQKGWRADYTVTRKSDEVKLKGTIWGVVHNGELHAIRFHAPALGFHARLAPRVERLAAAARLK
jgi:uncharacterized protein YceK